MNLNSVKQYNELYGLPTPHPLVTVLRLQDAPAVFDHIRIDYGLYAVFIKHGQGCVLRYGRREYDYQEGSVVSIAPGQSVTVEGKTAKTHDIEALLFHPDLIYGTSLARKMRQYSFFNYSETEALHLSAAEQESLRACLAGIKMELASTPDHHTRRLICGHIELFLDYCLRYYDRQFSTRHAADSEVLRNFENALDLYFLSEVSGGLPSVKFFADKACLTPSYFGDLIKKETGRTAQELIRLKIIDRAKEYLRGTSLTVMQISDMLGFQYPQHFTRMFKKQTGLTPRGYRCE